MAHEIDQSTGRPAFVSYKQVAWHGLGEVINERLTVEQLVERYPHLFPEVKIGQYMAHFEDGTVIPSAGAFYTYRDDTKAILGNVGERYHIVQNKEFFEILNFWDDYILETAGLLQGGAIAFFSANFQQEIKVGKDEVIVYLSGWDGHNGQQKLAYMLSPIRVVCKNTLNAAIKGLKWEYAIKHTENWRDKRADAANIVKMIQSGSLKLEEAYNHMANQRMKTDRQRLDFIANVFCSPQEIKAIKEAGHPLGVISTRKFNMMRDCDRYMFDGPGQQEMTSNPDFWLAYNGVTGYFCNERSYESAEDKLESLYLKTSVRAYTERAMALALEPSKMVPMGVNNFGEN